MRRPLLAAVLGLALAAPAASPAAPAAADAALGAGTAPSAFRAFAGTVSGSLGTLAARDEFGKEDDPAGYLRLDPGADRFVGVFVFHPPAGPLDLRAVLRTGAPGSWRVQAWDAAAAAWDTLWAGEATPAGRWVVRLLQLGAEHRDGGTVRIRLVGEAGRLRLEQLTLHPRPGVWRPPPGTTWQWQLSGQIDTSFDVAMYDIDLFEAGQGVIDQLHADGRVVVCYFSGGSWEDWRPDAGKFPAAVLGQTLEGWPDERWLDVRRLDLLGPIMRARLDLAAEKGCDGVEPDNMDAYANDSGFGLTAADQRAYNRWLAAQAHRRGLSVGLKNDLGQVQALLASFDWALNEQCFQYDECDALVPFVTAGKAVFGVEYTGKPAEFCPLAKELGFSWLKKRLALGPWVVPC